MVAVGGAVKQRAGDARKLTVAKLLALRGHAQPERHEHGVVFRAGAQGLGEQLRLERGETGEAGVHKSKSIVSVIEPHILPAARGDDREARIAPEDVARRGSGALATLAFAAAAARRGGEAVGDVRFHFDNPPAATDAASPGG